ncbi:uncharacterized protein V6R79_009851 [Siganus canaliculatus]
MEEVKRRRKRKNKGGGRGRKGEEEEEEEEEKRRRGGEKRCQKEKKNLVLRPRLELHCATKVLSSSSSPLDAAKKEKHETNADHFLSLDHLHPDLSGSSTWS